MEKGKKPVYSQWGSGLFSHTPSPGLINLELREYAFLFGWFD